MSTEEGIQVAGPNRSIIIHLGHSEGHYVDQLIRYLRREKPEAHQEVIGLWFEQARRILPIDLAAAMVTVAMAAINQPHQ